MLPIQCHTYICTPKNRFVWSIVEFHLEQIIVLSGVAHPKDKGCNVQPQAAQSACCAWHLGPLSLCRNWHGAGSSSKSQVLFYLSQSTSDLSRRTPQRDLPRRAVCFPSHLFCHIPHSEGCGEPSAMPARETD